jgi:hypothetical protein
MALLHEAHTYPAPHEAVLLFMDRTVRPEALPKRPRAAGTPVLADVIVRETLAVAEICEPCHFVPRWWKAPETAE